MMLFFNFSFLGLLVIMRFFVAVLFIYCIISVEYLLHVQCYKVAKMQHLIVAEYCTSSFPTDYLDILLYSSAYYMLNTKC